MKKQNMVRTKQKMTGLKVTFLLEWDQGVSDMGWVESLQMAINYIEDHLLDGITIEDIAKQASASPLGSPPNV